MTTFDFRPSSVSRLTIPRRRRLRDAAVTLEKDGARYALSHVGDGNYAYEGTDLEVESGDRFGLEILRGDAVITGSTQVPPPPSGLTISDSLLAIPQIGASGDATGFSRPDRSRFEESVTLTWSNPGADFYYVVVLNEFDGEPEYILPEFIRENFRGFEFVAEPTTENFFDVRIVDLEVYGEHEAILYRVNEEYADLYENREQDSRDLNEPPTNLTGGLGVFSAFNGAAVSFKVIIDEGA